MNTDLPDFCFQKNWLVEKNALMNSIKYINSDVVFSEKIKIGIKNRP